MNSLLALSLTGLLGITLTANADQTVTTITGDCSPVTTNSTINQPITVNCYQPKDERDLEFLTTAPLVKECVFRYPNSWSWIGDSASGENTLFPPPGNAFSQYDFSFTYGILQQTQWNYIFLNISELTYPLPHINIDKEAFEKIKNIRESTSGPFVQWRDYDMAFGETNNPEPVTRLTPLRAVIQLEGGKEIQSSNLDVFIRDNQLWSSVFMTSTADAYPDTTQDQSNFSPLYQFSCSAEKEMPSDLFAKMCSMLIEQTTLNQELTNQKCFQSDEGKFEAAEPNQATTE